VCKLTLRPTVAALDWISRKRSRAVPSVGATTLQSSRYDRIAESPWARASASTSDMTIWKKAGEQGQPWLTPAVEWIVNEAWAS